MSTGQTNTFAMPVVLQNLPPAETLNQVLDNLNYLCNVFDSAFDTITNQINGERAKIQSLQQRIEKASSRTDLVAKYPNKSTTVFSHCTFPKDRLEADDAIISPIEPTKYIDRPKYKLKISERLKRPPNCDTLKLFHSVSEKTAQKEDEKVVGLGKLPSWIDNVGDCLLFNTDTNPYLKYEAIQNLEGKEGVDKESEQKNMFQAPMSIRDKKGLIDQETYDIAYRPDLENVPTFQVNTTLSGFSGMGNLALDEGWSGFKKQQHKIAPSGINFGELPELEALPDFGGDDDFGFADAPVPPPKAPTPPPVPPSQPAASTATPGGGAAASQSKPGPAGPPPSEPAPKPSEAPSQAAAAPIKKAGGGGGGGRAALLDAIRSGKKLSNSRKERKQDQKAKAAPKRPMSLMDHLKDRLKARNNLISGKTEPSAKKDMIKPPPTLAEDDVLPDIGQGEMKSAEAQPDRTGLGLSNVPASMRTSMLLLDDDGDSGTDQDWNSDD
mmetsp:Transcript_59090/g.94053  ORF Transcript_59090/g.94053 Transcript_59090/m.94053 type:complete len:496 (-) Transcript_59090:42-1529(-)|eukprot:CAMPEP_0197041606 /NCGR_PEP_ID=MMETSP1384-20130603/18127_1 /TAXON_ID=29189 /ORGANISM="Ammonia sp." /LENGTH=495 /DNA_ID=CAMNT_0042472565 /DNA_START=23 /DNA_END=1510 /DNA_ORIENTATION=-